MQNANSARSDPIAESFNPEESWNWSIDESSSSTSTLNYTKPDASNPTTSMTSLDSFKQDGVADHLFPKMGKLADRHNNLLDNEGQANKNALYEPAKAPEVIRLRNSENLTSQWSTESQMSQESSDDILQTSESDKMLSRSSTISQSPISGQDGVGENLMPEQPVGSSETTQQYENVEILSNIKQNFPVPSPPVSNLTPPPAAALQSAKTGQTPPPPMKNQTPPLVATPSDDLRNNPYKRNTPLSHSAAAKKTLNLTDRPQPSGFQPFSTQSVNLETLPDNSEQPDSLLPSLNQKKHALTPTSQQLPDNNEVAPINERNQYLETGQLSDESTNQHINENIDALPPPGLRRMVLGQLESNDSNQNITADEPPPGLSRMVLGQTESSSSLNNTLRESNGPPVGFPRMVPGESSSPESNPRHQYQVYDNSEIEIPQTRSATIGADTPPTVANPVSTQSNMNRSETIGSDSKVDDVRPVGSNTLECRIGAMGVDRDRMEQDGTRRDSIEGQPQDVKDLVGSVRDMSISDVGGGSSKELEQNRGRSRQESSDSEREIDGNKSPR